MGKELLNSDKELLLKDLCARLPYEVKCNISRKRETCAKSRTIDSILDCHWLSECKADFYEIKPYLFPLSSMTEEQIEEAKTYFWKDVDYGKSLVDKGINCFYPHFNILEFYHKYHLDYRGLIEKGLAIDATGLNIY